MYKIIIKLIIVLGTIGCGQSNDITIPDTLNKKIVYTFNTTRQGEGAFIDIDNKILKYIYTCFTNSGSINDDEESNICSIESLDNGNTWVNKHILIKNTGKKNIMSVSVGKLKNGTISIFFMEKNSCMDLRLKNAIFDKELKSLISIETIDIENRYNVVLNDTVKFIKDKTYIAMSDHSCKNIIKNDYDFSGKIKLLIKDEFGYAFANTELINTDNQVNRRQEPGVIDLNDTVMLTYIRNNTKFLYVSYSKDEGKHWGKLYKTNIHSVPVSPISIKKYDKDLIVIFNKWENNNTGKERTPLVLAITSDLFKIKKEYLLEDNPKGWFCYVAQYRYKNNLFLAYYSDTNGKHFDKAKIVKINNFFKNVK